MNVNTSKTPVAIKSSKKPAPQKKAAAEAAPDAEPKETFTPSEDSPRVLEIPRSVITRGAPSLGGGALGIGAAIMFGVSGPLGLAAAALAGAGAGFGASSDTVVDYVGGKVQGYFDKKEAANAAESLKIAAIKSATPEQIKDHAAELMGSESWESRIQDYAFTSKVADFMSDVAEHRAMDEGDRAYIKGAVESVRSVIDEESWSRGDFGRLFFLTEHAHELSADKSLFGDPKFFVDNLKAPEKINEDDPKTDLLAVYGKATVMKEGVEKVLAEAPLDAWGKYTLSQRYSTVGGGLSNVEGVMQAWPEYHQIMTEAAKLGEAKA